MVDEALGEEFAGVLVSDFYAAYHHYDGPKQRCWAHLLRDIHDQRVLYPDDRRLGRWAKTVNLLYRQAKAFTHPSARHAAPPNWPWNVAAGPVPSLPGRPDGNPGQAVPAHGEPHQGAVRLRGRTGCAGGQQRR